jgi:hypothetical protein
VPPANTVVCYVDAPPLAARCSPAQIQALLDGTAVVTGRVVTSPSR